MAGQVKKSTKKFEKKHLKGELERRRSLKKVKQRHKLAEKKKAFRTKQDGNEQADDKTHDDEANPNKRSLQDMTMDEFFQGDFAIPETVQPNKRKKRERTQHPNPDSEEADKISNASDDDSIIGHKQDLEALASQDPEFYKYLEENDSELLHFDVPIGDLSDGEDARHVSSNGHVPGELVIHDGKKGSKSTVVTSAMISKWKLSMVDNHSLGALKEVFHAFRAAARTEDDSEIQFKYVIPSAAVFHEVLVLAMQNTPEVLNHHIPVKENSQGKTRISTDSKKFRAISSLLSGHVTSIVQLLGTLSDTQSLKVTLSSLIPLLPYTLPLKKPLKNLLKAVIGIWSDPTNDETVRINAFLLIRRAAIISDATTCEVVLKATYLGLVRGSRNTTVHTLPAINLMKNSALELWGFNGNIGYTTAFANIRQLAIHLRTSITQPTKDSHKTIYNWQYLHSLDFWSRVLATHCSQFANIAIKEPSDSPLHPLIYPLVQITLGALRLICTPAYFPLRFHLMQSLLRISRATNTYIPLAPSLLEVLQSPELRNPPRASTLRPFDFAASIRAPKQYLRTRVYQDGVGEQVVFLLAEFFGTWAKSIAFPELIIPPTVFLKRWLKEVAAEKKHNRGEKGGLKGKGNSNQKLNGAVSLLLQKITSNASFVERHRQKVDYAVSNRAGVESFLRETKWDDMPLGAYVQGLRRQKEEQERMLEESRQEQRMRDKGDTELDDDIDQDKSELESDLEDEGDEDLDEDMNE